MKNTPPISSGRSRTSGWVQLDYAGSAPGVVVTPEDQDRFMLPMQAAIDGCRLMVEQDKVQRQFKVLLERLQEWARRHSADVLQVHLGFRDSRLLFLVERRSARFNRELEDELTELDIEIAREKQLDSISLQVLAIPGPSPESVASILAPGLVMTYRNAERRSPHPAG